jgi:hypothetical protein
VRYRAVRGVLPCYAIASTIVPLDVLFLGRLLPLIINLEAGFAPVIDRKEWNDVN